MKKYTNNNTMMLTVSKATTPGGSVGCFYGGEQTETLPGGGFHGGEKAGHFSPG